MPSHCVPFSWQKSTNKPGCSPAEQRRGCGAQLCPACARVAPGVREAGFPWHQKPPAPLSVFCGAPGVWGQRHNRSSALCFSLPALTTLVTPQPQDTAPRCLGDLWCCEKGLSWHVQWLEVYRINIEMRYIIPPLNAHSPVLSDTMAVLTLKWFFFRVMRRRSSLPEPLGPDYWELGRCSLGGWGLGFWPQAINICVYAEKMLTASQLGRYLLCLCYNRLALVVIWLSKQQNLSTSKL